MTRDRLSKRQLRARQDQQRRIQHRSTASGRVHATAANLQAPRPPLESQSEPFLATVSPINAREPLERLRGHKLLPADVQARLPKLRSQDGKGLDAFAVVKFFSPYITPSRYMYITEGQRDDDYLWELYGLSVYYENEWGPFSLREIAETPVPQLGGVPAFERDCHWEPRPVRECEGVDA